MSSYKANIHYATNEDDNRNQAVFIATNVENIPSILYIVCRRKLLFQVYMAMPLCGLDNLHPFVQWFCSVGM